MSLNKTLAMMSAGALMLIGQSALAQDEPPQDRGVDRSTQVHAQTGDERTGPTVRTRSQVWTEAEEEDEDDDLLADDDAFEDDDEFVAQDDQFVQDDEVGVRDDEFLVQEDEFRTDEFAEEDEFVAEERIETQVETEESATDFHVHERTEAGVDTRTTMSGALACPCPPQGQVGVDWQVDETRLNTLARINVEMLDETRELADQLASAQDVGQAQQLQLEMLERQMQVIERHGWSREEYNAVVTHVNEDQELRGRYIDTVVQQDAQVAVEFEAEDEVAVEFEAEDEAEAEFTAEIDTDVDEDEEDEIVAGEFEDDDWR